MIKSALIEITNKCNLQCVHCFYNDYIAGYEMDIKNIVHILKKVSAIEDLDSIAISGGEPFLHSRVTDILKICGEEFNKTKFLIVTNGMVMNDEILNLYSKYNNIAINVSVDGSVKQINDKIRGDGTYDKLIKSIEKLSSIDNNRLNIRMTIQKYNYKDVGDFFYFAKKYNIGANYLFVAECGTAKLKWSEVGLSVSNKMYCYNELKKIYKKFNLDTPLPGDPGGCGPRERIIINPRGDIYFCNILNAVFPDYFIGNILEDSIESIVKMLDKNELTDKIDAWQKEVCENECVGCEVINLCEQGCYAMYIARKNREGKSGYNNSLLDGNCVSKKYKYLLDKREALHVE